VIRLAGEVEVEPQVLQALRDAIAALSKAESVLDDLDRPALAHALTTLRALDHLLDKHAEATLDLRMSRLRLQALLGQEDEEKTPVDHPRKASQQLRIRKPGAP